MLISFHKGFLMEGETTFSERKHFWSKPQKVREKIYSRTGISGVCDESELEAEVERLTNARLASSGWGEDFSGWQRIVPYDESVMVAWRNEWEVEDLPKCELTTESLDSWTVQSAASKLNGKQFAQYCRDYGIPCYNKE